MALFKKPSLILLSILTLLIIIIGLTYADYGKTWDENDTVSLGNHALTYYTSFGKDRSYFSFYPQQAFYLTRGPAIETLRAVITTLAHNNSTEFYHLIIALFAVSSVIFIFLIIYRLTKRISLAAFSSFLLLLLPRFYGDIFTNSKDIAPLYILLGTIYCSILFFQGKRNFGLLFSLGFLLGLGASLRIILLYVYGVFVIFAFLQTVVIEKKSLLIFLKQQLFLGVITCVSLYIFQPYLLSHPIFGIWQMLEASKKFPETIQVLFAGKMYESAHLPWFYLPWYITITTPIVTLILFIIGTIFILLKKRTLVYLYILSIFWIPFLLVTFFSCCTV